MSDKKTFETAGQKAVARLARKIAPTLSEVVDALIPWYAEEREARRRRALEELVHAFADADGEMQLQERIEWIFEDEHRVDELLKHINALTLDVHPNARKAYIALAADSMAGRISYDLARDLGQLLRHLSGRESPILARLVLTAERNSWQINDGFARHVSHEGKTIATRLINRLVNAGLATPLRAKQPNLGSPAWGCTLNDAEMGLTPLVRYANLLIEAAEADQ